MIVSNQGKTLGAGDLGLNIRGLNGGLTDPYSISYSIFSVGTDGLRTLVSAPNMSPTRNATGVYYIGGNIPTTWEGRYDLIWTLRQTNTDAPRNITEEFEVVRIDPATSSFEAPSVLVSKRPGLNPTLVDGIMKVREILSDENPDRNYHFRPPTPGIAVANFNLRVGFIWTDSTIIRMLQTATSIVNTANPMNLYSYTYETAPVDWRNIINIGAAGLCLTKEAARWAAEGMEYSLNGVSLSLNKAGEYQSLSTDLSTQFNAIIPNLTANRPVSSGLRQQRWLL